MRSPTRTSRAGSSFAAAQYAPAHAGVYVATMCAGVSSITLPATSTRTVVDESLWSCMKMTSEDTTLPSAVAASTLSPTVNSLICTGPLSFVYTSAA